MDCNLSNKTVQERTSTIQNELGTLSDFQLQADFICDRRRKMRRDNEILDALSTSQVLSSRAQEALLDGLLTGGWGRLAHCITPHLKAPGRYGHRQIDIALIMTVYDHTVASVNPVLYAAISVPEFEEDTAMDEANIRKALNQLVAKGPLLKIKASPRVIFWALNPHFFRKEPTFASPKGKSTQVTAPCIKKGNSPCVNTGQINPGGSLESIGNQREKTVAKNLLKESKKESLLCGGDFPEDMLARWSQFQQSGLEGRIKKEKEIFEKLFLEHKDPFFEFCGRVVEFVSEHVTGKGGAKIDHPMSWIDGHWQTNFSSYQQWKTKKDALEASHAERLEREAKAQVEKAERERLEALEKQEEQKWVEQIDAAALRFLDQYPTEKSVNAFAQEALGLLGCSYTLANWKKFGWTHSLGRTAVLEHFMKVESGERTTQIKAGSEGVGA